MEKEKNVYDTLGGNVAEEIKQYPLEKMDLLTTDNAGKKTTNRCVENVFRILERHPFYAGRFRFDEWTQKLEIKDKKVWREIDDTDYTPIQREISSMYVPFRSLSKEMVIDAVGDACRAHSFDRAINFIRKEAWDKKPRLDTWLSKVYGTAEDEYHKAVGSNFFKGMVKRIIKPGCKFDTVLIL